MKFPYEKEWVNTSLNHMDHLVETLMLKLIDLIMQRT